MTQTRRTFLTGRSIAFSTFLILLLLPLHFSSGLMAADSTYTLIFETIRYGKLEAVIGKYRIVETISPDRFDIAIFEYRLDRMSAFGAYDSTLVVRNGVELPPKGTIVHGGIHDHSALKAIVPEQTTLQLASTGDSTTICGLPARKYALGAEGSVEMFIWLSEPPPGLDRYNLATYLEFENRSATFVLSEFLRQTARTALSHGIEWPAQSGNTSYDLIVVRIDTGVDTGSLLARDNSFVFELKSLTPVTDGATEK